MYNLHIKDILNRKRERLPTDLEILNKIYDNYYDDYAAYSDESKTRSTKIYVPIDIKKLSKELNAEVDIIFGRLYYYLNNRYSYKQDDGSRVDLFSLKVGNDTKVVNFPYLSSILAEQQDKNVKYRVTTIIAIIALIIAIASILVSVFT